MKKVILVAVCMLIAASWVQGNNVKLTKQVYVDPASFSSNTVVLDFTISWDNSWRDDYNWDAVYVFLKCKRKSETVWNHVTLMDAGHVVSSGYDWWVNKFSTTANIAQGIFIQPSAKTSGKAVVNVKAKWNLAPLSYKQQEFIDDEIDYVAMCVEMVYIPKGLFYVGDGIANRSLKQEFTSIWPEWDLMDADNPRLRIWSDDDTTNTRYWDSPPVNIANRINDATTGAENAWFATGEGRSVYIDLGEPKTIKYLGVSGAGSTSYRPSGTSTFYGSVDGKSWKLLRYVYPEEWTVEAVTYPVPRALKIAESSRAAYRYYRLYCGSGASNKLNNLAMTEVDVEGKMQKPYLVSKETIAFNATIGLSAGDGETWSSTLQAQYPTGYEGFYVMKYEISQEQYVRFLNKLTGEQQKLRTVGSRLDALQVGDYVYGSTPATPSYRNGIVVAARLDESVVFANDLDKSNEISQEGDGQTLACNYLSPMDMLAYASWAALRPLSEMEYEKMCRPLYPSLAKPGDWPWNSNDIADVKKPLSTTITDAGTSSEKVDGANTNAGNVIQGPVRAGSFAKGATSQQEAGASYWGVMELGGNLAEMCYNVNISKGRTFAGRRREAHGHGTLAATGETDISTSYWLQTPESISVRGGSYRTTDYKQLMVSDRTSYVRFSDINKRDPDVTFRLGYSFTYPYRVATPAVEPCTTYLQLANGKKSTSNGAATEVICDDQPYTINGSVLLSSGETPKTPDGKVSYVWLISDDASNWREMPGEVGQNLTYHFKNRRAGVRYYYIKRLTTTPTLESETFYVRLDVINTFMRINRLRDTLNQNNHALGFLLETGGTAKHVWKWTGAAVGAAALQTNTSVRLYDYYFPKRSDFNNGSGQTYTVRCEATILNQCVVNQDVEVYVEPRAKTGVPSDAITMGSGNSGTDCGVLMQDARDDQVYGTVKIDKQCWMAENLRRVQPGGIASVFKTGDPDGSLYGVLYQWSATLHASVCPEGWRMPLKADYDQLVTYLNKDGKNMSGIKMKAGNYWNTTNAIGVRNAIGKNTVGFGAIGAGYDATAATGASADFLTTADAGTSGIYFHISSTSVTTFVYAGAASSNYRSVRCIKK